MATDPTGRVSHVQEMHRGLTWKPACRVATTANITISTALNNGDTLDGVTLATGDRVLVKDQSTASQNGIYIVGATPTRAADMDQDTTTTTIPAEEIAGAVVFVISGTVNTKTIWYTTNAVGGTVGSTSIVWAQFSGSGLTDPMTTRGDIIVRNASNVTARLAIGAAGKILSSDGTDVSWGNGPMTTQDDIIVGGASGIPTRLAKGSDSQVLTVDPTTHHLVWATPTTGFSNPMTTKGDLIVGDTGGSPIRKAVGSNGLFLSADSASTGGVKWDSVATGGGATPVGAGTIVNTKTYAACTSGVAITLGFTPTNGNIILGYVTTNIGQATAITTTNVTWTLVGRARDINGNQQVCDVWLGVVSGSPGNTATITFTAPSAQGAAFEEFSGLSTVDSAESWLNRESSTSGFQNPYHSFSWQAPGGRVICLFGNSTGGAISVPTGWTRNLAAGSYGGTASASVLTIDASALSIYSHAIFVDPVANDNHVGIFVHLIP